MQINYMQIIPLSPILTLLFFLELENLSFVLIDTIARVY